MKATPARAHHEQETRSEIPLETQQEIGDTAVDGAFHELQQAQVENLGAELKISPTLAGVVAREIDTTNGIHTGGSGVKEGVRGEASLGKADRFSESLNLRYLSKGERPFWNSVEGNIDRVINETAGSSPEYLVAIDSNNEVFTGPLFSGLSVAESLEKTVVTLEHTLIRDPELMDNPNMKLVFPTTQVNAREGGPTVAIGRELVKTQAGTRMIETAVTYSETDDGGVEATGFTVVVREPSQEERDFGNQWNAAEKQAQAA